MSKINSYPFNSGENLMSVGCAVQNFLANDENMQTQVLESCQGEVIVQGKASGGRWKQWIGMDKAITVKLSADNGVLTAEVGDSKWVDKVLAEGVSMFVLWPLAITAGVGMYKQAKLPGKIFHFIREYVNF